MPEESVSSPLRSPRGKLTKETHAPIYFQPLGFGYPPSLPRGHHFCQSEHRIFRLWPRSVALNGAAEEEARPRRIEDNYELH